jgi:hypothetical protein
MMTREQRLKEREVKRILHEEQLAKEQEQLAALEREGALPNGEKARMSERQLKADMEKRKKELEELGEEEWVFDCAVCGVYGQNWVRYGYNNVTEPLLTAFRMMVLTVLHARSAMCGSIVLAMVSIKLRPNERISISSAKTASTRWRTQCRR